MVRLGGGEGEADEDAEIFGLRELSNPALFHLSYPTLFWSKFPPNKYQIDETF